jgi:predicted nucleic acid-binding Zn ribbon protein
MIPESTSSKKVDQKSKRKRNKKGLIIMLVGLFSLILMLVIVKVLAHTAK